MKRAKPQEPRATLRLVRCAVYYRRSNDDLNALLRELHKLYPRCYHIEWRDSDVTAPVPAAEATASLRETVLGYLQTHLADHADRAAVLALAEKLLLEEPR